MIIKMILVTHGLIGAALTHRYANGALIFLTAMASHYVFDMVPHWHYRVPRIHRAVNAASGEKTLTLKAAFLPDIGRIVIDLVMGLVLSTYLFPGSEKAIVIGVMGAVTPDLLVGLSHFYPARILVWHDRFHRWIHTPVRIDHRPLIGITSQIAIALFFIFFFR
jgi:hypothetical protein